MLRKWFARKSRKNVDDTPEYFPQNLNEKNAIGDEKIGQNVSEFSSEQNFMQHNLFDNIEKKYPYVEHRMTVSQLGDIYPLSRLDERHPANSKGLNEDEAMLRLVDGKNNLIRSWNTLRYRVRLFGVQFLNMFRLLLFGAALICALIFFIDRSRCDEIIMAAILGIALILMCSLSYLEQRKSLKQICGFRNLVPTECTVVREGNERRISANQLVCGDLVRIRVGDRLSADVRLIDTHDLRIEASWIVGMVEPLEYIHEPALPGIGVLDAQNVVFSGSFCTSGTGLGIVIRVGNKTLIGHLMEVIAKEEHTPSCLETEHTRFVRFIIIVSLAMATVTFGVGLYLNSFAHFATIFINGFLIVLVANVPQGLPVTLTAQLLIVVRRLSKKCGGMCLKSIETADTLGITSALITDKTGVLTCGTPNVTDFWMMRKFFSANVFEHRLVGGDETESFGIGSIPIEVQKPYRNDGLTLDERNEDDDAENAVDNFMDVEPNSAKRLEEKRGIAGEKIGVRDEQNLIESKPIPDEKSSSNPLEKHSVLSKILEVMSVCSTAYIEGALAMNHRLSSYANSTFHSINDLDNNGADGVALNVNDLTTRSMLIWPPSRISSFRRRQRHVALRSRSVCSVFERDAGGGAYGNDGDTAGGGEGTDADNSLDVQRSRQHAKSLSAANFLNVNADGHTRNSPLTSISDSQPTSRRATHSLQRKKNSSKRTEKRNKNHNNSQQAKSKTEHILTHEELNEAPSKFQGRPIDVALLCYVERLSSVEAIRKRYEFVYEIPFSSDRRYHLTIVAERCGNKPHPSGASSAGQGLKRNGKNEWCDVEKDVEDDLDIDDEYDDEIMTYKLMVKGAPEEIIRNCTSIVGEDGQIELLSDDHLVAFEKAYLKYGDEGKTCLAFASLEFDAFANTLFYSPSFNCGTSNSSLMDALFTRFPESGWCFLGMVALWDAPRPHVINAVQKAERAGVRFFMVTGDHPASAEALARQIGFSTTHHSVEKSNTSVENGLIDGDMNGKISLSKTQTVTQDETAKRNASCASSGYSSANDIDSYKASASSVNSSKSAWHDEFENVVTTSNEILSNELTLVHGNTLNMLMENELSSILRKRRVIFARISPSQKLQLVKQCQKLNYTVTMTGDGLMDSLALKKSDIGIASNLNGSVFAREAADIVIAERDISNIIRGIEEARLLYDNLKKTIAYTLSHLLPELLPVILSFIFGFPLGLNSLQILIIDLLTEIPPSVALIFEPPERDIMRRAPRKRHARLVTPQILFYAYAQAGLIISVGCALAYFSVFWSHNLTVYDLKNTSRIYWHNDSPTLFILRTNSSTLIMDGSSKNRTSMADMPHRSISTKEQIEIRAQANAAWHITLVITQILHSFICSTRRTSLFRHGIRNAKLTSAAIFEILFLSALIFIPYVQDICGLKPPPDIIWIFPIVLGAILLIYNEGRKFLILRHSRNRFVKMLKW